MADDLGEEWWLEEKTKNSDSKKSTNKTIGNATLQKDSKLIKKRILEYDAKNSIRNPKERTPKRLKCSDSDEEKELESAVCVLKVEIKKTHSRRKITDELVQKGDEPLCPSNLVVILNKHYEGKLTAVEKDEILLEESHFSLCNDTSHTPTSFMKSLFPKWKKMLKCTDRTPGSPLLLILCSSAVRAVNFIRLISEFKGDDCKVAKLFAKHLKFDDQLKFLKTTVVHIGVGTPNRIQLLLESGELHLDHAKFVVFDWSWRDIKQKRLMDIPQVRQDTFSLLSKFIIPSVKNSSVKLALL